MRFATSKLTDTLTVHPTAPERSPIAIAPNQTVDLDRVIGEVPEEKGAVGAAKRLRPYTLGEAIGRDYLRSFDIDSPAPAKPAAGTRGAAAPEKEK